MKTRKSELKELHLAVKQHLIKRGLELEVVMFVATNVVCRIEQNKDMTIKNIQSMKDVFLKAATMEVVS